MPDYIVLRKTGDTQGETASDWTPAAIILGVADEEAAVTEANGGEGRYAALEWSDETQFDVASGPLEVKAATLESPVEDEKLEEPLAQRTAPKRSRAKGKK